MLCHTNHAREFVTDIEQSHLLPVNIQALETRYDFENRCIQAITQGNLSLIDQLSGKFAKKTEALTTVPEHTLEREMLHKYCLLVRNYSLKGYSPIIRKVINQINLNMISITLPEFLKSLRE